MIKSLRCLLALALLLLPLADASAGSSTITTKDASGVTKTFFVTTDGSGNFYSAGVICDQSAAATCASVGTAGSPSTNALTVQAVTIGSGTAANAQRVELANNGTGVLATVGAVTTVSTVTTLSTLTGGGVASAAADSGNPLKVGGKYNASPITLTDGNRGDLQLDVNGYTKVNVTNANANIANNADAVAAGAGCCSPVTNYGYVWNGSTWDRQAGTTAGTKITAASGSLASGAVVDITNISVATGAAPPSKAIYLGANASGATGGFVRGLINCDSHVFKHITSATDTLAVQGVASQTIYVCGWRSRAAGVATWFLENTASANANCSSSNTQITGVATEAANTGEVAKSAFWDGVKNTSGNGLCINSTGTGGVDIDVWYTQF